MNSDFADGVMIVLVIVAACLFGWEFGWKVGVGSGIFVIALMPIKVI